ncbi:MAG: hypothetical protein WC821_02885 [archaeon]|jgi:flagellar protein FlaI
MSTDYLEDIIGSAKATTQAEELAPVEPTKPEDKEEKIAQEVKHKDMQEFKKESSATIEPTSAEKTAIEKELEENKKIEVDSYGKVKIYRIPGKPLAYYFIPTIRPTSADRKIINTLKEATTRLISIAPYKIRNPEERRIVYKQKIIEIMKSNPNMRIPEQRIPFYADAVVREMVGYGLIDDLIKDDQLEEIMIVGPKKPVYVFHRKYEMMTTNIEFFQNKK